MQQEEKLNKIGNFTFNFEIRKGCIGWSIYEVNELGSLVQLCKAGVRVFSDGVNPKNNETLNSARRANRISRRKRDRLVKRKKTLLSFLIKSNILPSDEYLLESLKVLNVYELRSKGIREKLELIELGRIFLHINKRRGYLSCRSVISSHYKQEIARVKKFENFLIQKKYPTIGCYLNQMNSKKKGLRFRDPEGFLPGRHLYADEFDKIVEVQKEFYPNIAENVWQRIREIIFFQRPLKNVEEKNYKCRIFPDEVVAPKYSMGYQKILLLQRIEKLKLVDVNENLIDLSKDEKKRIYDKVMESYEEISLDSIGFYLDRKERIILLGDASKKLGFSPFVNRARLLLKNNLENNPELNLDNIFEKLDTNKHKLNSENVLSDLGINNSDYEKLIDLELPRGDAHYSRKAISHILNLIENNSLSLEEAIEKVKTESISISCCPVVIQENLVIHPTIKNVLNQLEILIELFIKRYGSPKMIKYEVAEELKLSYGTKKEINSKKIKTTLKKERAKEILSKKYHVNGPSYDQVARYVLWEELKKSTDSNTSICPFTLQPITFAQLFSEDIVIVKLLPFSRSLNDSFDNKTICYRSAAIEKGNGTIWEAFSSSTNYDFEKILKNCSILPAVKRRHFFREPSIEFMGYEKLINQQMEDKSHVSEIVKSFVIKYCKSITTVSNGIVSLLEFALRFPKMEIKDFRVHALRAVCLGVVSKEFLDLFIKENEFNINEITCKEPCFDFHKTLHIVLDEIKISRKENHKNNGKLHDETYYGEIKHPNSYEKEHGFNLVVRRKITDIRPSDICLIRASNIRSGFKENMTQVQIIKKFNKIGVKKIRVLKKDKSAMYLFHPASSKKFYKCVIPSEIHSVDVWRLPKQDKIKRGSNLKFETYNLLEVAMKIDKKPHPAAKRVLRIHKWDTLKIVRESKAELVWVRTIRPSKQLIGVVPLNQNSRSDKDTIWITFSMFEKMSLQRLKITPEGIILDMKDPYEKLRL